MHGNHWITLSNVKCSKEETSIYDSYQALNVDVKQKKISFPMEVDYAACQLIKREKSFDMLVEDIQQQKGGDDCGLFAITFSALLCAHADSAMAEYKQNIMRRELVKCFEGMSLLPYINSVVTSMKDKQPEIMYEWICSVFCICGMPDDGKEMGECYKCKDCFHKDCVQADFSTKTWMCTKCKDTTRRDAALK